MALDALIAAAALAGLAVAAEQLVMAASRIAVAARVSAVTVGAVVVGIGTSVPDGVVAGVAGARGDAGLALGTIVGSNTVNVGLGLGLAALVMPLTVSSGVLRREAVVSLAAVAAFAVAMVGGLGALDGVVLAGLLVVAGLWARRMGIEPPAGGRPPDRGRLPVEIARFVVALAVIVVCARLLVGAAEQLALSLGVSQALVGLTVLALGTSLPEIVVSVQAARRGEVDLVVGNILGSNVFNSLAVGAAVGLVSPGGLAVSGLGVAAAIMVALVALTTFLLATGRRLERWEGALLVAGYVATLLLTR